MMKCGFLLLLLFCTTYAGASDEIKGFRLGMALDEVKDRAPGINCETERDGEETCRYFVLIERQHIPVLTTIGDKQATAWQFEFSGGKLQRITVRFQHHDYKEVVRSLIVKHGQPINRYHDVLQNGLRARFKSEVLVWPKRKGGTLYALERFVEQDTSALGVFSENYEANSRHRERIDSKRRAKDL